MSKHFLLSKSKKILPFIFGTLLFTLCTSFADQNNLSPYSSKEYPPFPPNTTHKNISNTELKDLNNRFYKDFQNQTGMQVFASQYTMKVSDIKACIASSSYCKGSIRIFNGLDASGNKTFALSPLNGGYYNLNSPSYLKYDGRNLCPVNCDFDGGSAEAPMDAQSSDFKNCKSDVSRYYANAMSGKGYDKTLGFVLDDAIIDNLISNKAELIKVFYGMDDQTNQRSIIICGADYSGNINTEIMKFDLSGLCPVNCD